MVDYNLKQIVPASPGWLAVYWLREPPYYGVLPVAVWGMFEVIDRELTYNTVDAVDPGTDGFVPWSLDTSNSCERYWHESHVTEAVRTFWAEAAQAHWARMDA